MAEVVAEVAVVAEVVAEVAVEAEVAVVAVDSSACPFPCPVWRLSN